MICAAAATFCVEVEPGTDGFNVTNAPTDAVYGPIMTTVTLIESKGRRLCLIMPNGLAHTFGLYVRMQRVCADILGIGPDDVVVPNSHNHSSPQFSREPLSAFWGEGETSDSVPLTEVGRRFFDGLRDTLSALETRLEPVTVRWGVGDERTISYNRKGRRADGSTYFMREEDRIEVGHDFSGDVDPEVPVVSLSRADGTTMLVLLHFTAHPATAYDPERPNVYGEYPQVACELISRQTGGAPVGFLQGAAGDINSKGLLTGDVAQARWYGLRLGRAALRAMDAMTDSYRSDADWCRVTVGVPLAPIPSVETLEARQGEILRFIERAEEGDADTLECIGLNFPRALTPAYRAGLVKPLLEWTEWALARHAAGESESLPTEIPMDVSVVRIGDVGMVGMPCEPFVGIGRQIRRWPDLPLTLPVGYTNVSYGYVPDGPNTGDREYMSAFYLYTRYRPPYRKPAGDVLAHAGLEALRSLTGASARSRASSDDETDTPATRDRGPQSTRST